jgi:hypothetical protein
MREPSQVSDRSLPCIAQVEPRSSMLQRSISGDEKPVGFERSPASDENVGVLVSRHFKYDYYPLLVWLAVNLLLHFSKISLKSDRLSPARPYCSRRTGTLSCVRVVPSGARDAIRSV